MLRKRNIWSYLTENVNEWKKSQMKVCIEYFYLNGIFGSYYIFENNK